MARDPGRTDDRAGDDQRAEDGVGGSTDPEDAGTPTPADDPPDAADPDDVAEARDSGTDVHEEENYDAEEPQAEWHVWLAGIVAMVGVAIWLAPAGFLPELLAGLAPILVGVAVVGWAGQYLYRRAR